MKIDDRHDDSHDDFPFQNGDFSSKFSLSGEKFWHWSFNFYHAIYP